MKECSISVFILIALAGIPTHAQQVTREPYMQLGTPSSMVIRWRTDIAVVGKVNFGTALSGLNNSISETTAATEHILHITGLSSTTIYYYDIGTTSSVLLQANAEMYFKTSPPPGTVQPIRAWVIGDFGNASQRQIDVMNSYLNSVAF
ncbi:MAG: hypothetical protein SH857_09255 [Chitinophagales bacterium]|nr:hypothetical protein [Chitinophagales bacterium]